MSNDRVNVLHELAMAGHWLYMINKSKAKNPQRYKDYAARVALHVNTAQTETQSQVWSDMKQDKDYAARVALHEEEVCTNHQQRKEIG